MVWVREHLSAKKSTGDGVAKVFELRSVLAERFSYKSGERLYPTNPDQRPHGAIMCVLEDVLNTGEVILLGIIEDGWRRKCKPKMLGGIQH